MLLLFITWGAGGLVSATRKKHRCILPDGSVVWATKDEMKSILAKLANEFNDSARIVVPTIQRERKKTTFEVPEEVSFPRDRPVVQMSKSLETPRFDLDIEAMLRAYIAGTSIRKRQRSEEEWLLMLAL